MTASTMEARSASRLMPRTLTSWVSAETAATRTVLLAPMSTACSPMAWQNARGSATATARSAALNLVRVSVRVRVRVRGRVRGRVRVRVRVKAPR